MAGFQDQQLRRHAERSLAGGDLAAAEAACRRLLARDRRDVTAMQILAAVAFQRGRHEQAVELLDRCVALKPRDPDLRCNLAKAWTATGELARALAAYDRALRIRPRHAEAIAGKADLLERRGDDEPARSLLGPFLDAGDETPSMAVVAARMLDKLGESAAAVALARRHLDRSDLPAAARRQVGFIMGWALERQGDCAGAFAAYRDANEVGRRPFDAHSATALVERMIEVCSAGGLGAIPRAELDGSRAVFIVGMPRTGSTLVERIIDAHPGAHGAGELHAMGELVTNLAFELPAGDGYPECLARLTEPVATRLGRAYLGRLPAGPARVADKNLDNFTHLGLISRLLPGARVVHVRRDPLDTCLSCYAQPLSPRKHPYASDLGNLGIAYRLYRRLVDHWREVLDLPWLDVDYEGLVADQEAQSRRLVEFLGLPWDAGCLAFHESPRDVMTLSYAQVRRPLYSASVGRAARFDGHLGPLRDELQK